MPECGNCRDCKWWTKNATCWHPKPKWVTSDHDENIITEPDFGCVQFEVKDA